MLFLSDPDCDALAADWQDDPEEASALEHLLPWLTSDERSARMLGDNPRFPGLWASGHELTRFAAELTRGAQRLVDCQLALYGVSVTAHLDLVSKKLFLREDGRLKPFDDSTYTHLRFPQLQSMVFGYTRIIFGEADLQPSQIRDLVAALHKAKLLPPVRRQAFRRH